MRFWPATAAAGDHPRTADAHEAAARAAYDRGRRDERARRRRSPVLALAVGSAALVGGAVLALAAMEGSFAEGGAAVDPQVGKTAPAPREAGKTLLDSTQGAGKAPINSDQAG